MSQDEDWEDVEIWDANAIFNCATDLAHDAKLAKEAGDFINCSLYISKALNMMSDVEMEFPNDINVLRCFIEEI